MPITLTAQHHSRINDALYEIHRDISAPLSGRHLASVAAYSEQHFHRVFRQVVGHSVHDYIRKARLEYAANQLMFNPDTPIALAAEKCGFKSQASFCHAFKATYGVTPSQWRKNDTPTDATDAPYLKDPEIASCYRGLASAPLPKPKIVELEPQAVAYIRHQGYDRNIGMTWQRLLAWARAEQRPHSLHIGLHHSNPTLVPLEDCRYVACIGIDAPMLKRGQVSTLQVPGGLHACFAVTGRYGELLPYISKVCTDWLPRSGFKMRATPIFAKYLKNHFIRADEQFEVELYIPLSVL